MRVGGSRRWQSRRGGRLAGLGAGSPPRPVPVAMAPAALTCQGRAWGCRIHLGQHRAPDEVPPCERAALAHLWCPRLINDLKSNGKLKLGKDLPSLGRAGQLPGAVHGWDAPIAALLPRAEPEAAPPHRASLGPGAGARQLGAEPWGLLAVQSPAKLVTWKIALSETCSGAGFIR